MTPPALPDAVAIPGFVAGAALAEARSASWLADLSSLCRPRIAVMELATVAAAVWLTGGRPESPVAIVLLLVGTALVAASSSIANQILERDSDRAMPRTAARPIAAGRLAVREAWWLASAMLAAGCLAMTVAADWRPTAAAVATWLLYVLAYTPLKRTTPLNTAVGAVAGRSR